MNKTQLIEAMAAQGKISKTDAKRSLDAFITVASEVLRAGDKITINGFGSFVVTRKPARMGRNFRTGLPVEIPAKSVVTFRPAMAEVPVEVV